MKTRLLSLAALGVLICIAALFFGVLAFRTNQWILVIANCLNFLAAGNSTISSYRMLQRL